MVNEFKLRVLTQRLKYFINGNFHGVSANWLGKKCDALFQNVQDYVESDLCPFPIVMNSIKDGEVEFSRALDDKSGVNYRNNFDCEIGLATFLYSYILTVRPTCVIETGVANGITTNVMMRALEITGGTLHSFDIDEKTANVYVGKGNWKFHLLTGNYEKCLTEMVSNLGKTDLWVHDSNHGYSWQSFEYELAAHNLNSHGILVSDDIDSSTAWGLATEHLFVKSIGVFDRRKFFGVASF